MATLYVKHTGSNTAPYDTWANAATTLKTAMEAAAAGDTIYVASTHSETSAGTAITINGTGTLAAPLLVLSVTEATPPTTLTAGASVTTTGTAAITINGNHYVFGITFSAGSGAVNSAIILSSTSSSVAQVYEQCSFIQGSTATSNQQIRAGTTSTAANREFWFKDCWIKFSGTGLQAVQAAYAALYIEGGGILAGTATPTALFTPASSANARIRVSGFDLSAFGAGINIFTPTINATFDAEIRDCKLPASWSGSLLSAIPTSPHAPMAMHNCDSGDTNYHLWVDGYYGSIRDETTVVRTGGASDGTTALSWKMAASANTVYPSGILRSPEIVIWNDTVGSSKTVTVEVLTDGVTLKDDECWLEVMYLGTSGYPLGSWTSDAKADVLATAANQTSSTATWTTTGLASPVKQKLAVTLTPQEKGYIHARVCLAKPSTTVYVDPLLSVA